MFWSTWLFLLCCLICCTAVSQDVLSPTPNPCVLIRAVEPYPALREADVLWERRIWRTVDLRAAANVPLNGDRGSGSNCPSLLAVIQDGLLNEGAITGYRPDEKGGDDAFRQAYTSGELSELFQKKGLEHMIPRLMLKEDWILDNSRSDIVVRIIGMAFQVEKQGEDGELTGYETLLWMYYPECRLQLGRWVAGKGEDGTSYSYDDLFLARRFASTIVQRSNASNSPVNGTRTGLDALLESEAIEQRLQEMGLDLWQY